MDIPIRAPFYSVSQKRQALGTGTEAKAKKPTQSGMTPGQTIRRDCFLVMELHEIKMHATTILYRPLVSFTSRAQALPPLIRGAALRGSPMRSRARHTSSLDFSTQTRLLDNMPRQPRPSEKNEPATVDIPSLSFEALGIGRRMKLFLIACFCVLGTMETWFWYKAFWVWWKGADDESPPRPPRE